MASWAASRDTIDHNRHFEPPTHRALGLERLRQVRRSMLGKPLFAHRAEVRRIPAASHPQSRNDEDRDERDGDGDEQHRGARRDQVLPAYGDPGASSAPLSVRLCTHGRRRVCILEQRRSTTARSLLTCTNSQSLQAALPSKSTPGGGTGWLEGLNVTGGLRRGCADWRFSSPRVCSCCSSFN
jgi:hypothetical protein